MHCEEYQLRVIWRAIWCPCRLKTSHPRCMILYNWNSSWETEIQLCYQFFVPSIISEGRRREKREREREKATQRNHWAVFRWYGLERHPRRGVAFECESQSTVSLIKLRTVVSSQHLWPCKNEYTLPCFSLAALNGGWKHFFVIAFNSMLGSKLRLRLSWAKLSILCHRGFCVFEWHQSWRDTEKRWTDAPTLGLIPVICCFPGPRVGSPEFKDSTHPVRLQLQLLYF